MSDRKINSTGPQHVEPRHAASLIIHRQDGKDLRVLMGKRGSKARFIPDAYVFPGGRLDPGDMALPAVGMPADTRTHLEQTRQNARLADPLAHTALRETLEETGLEPGKNAAAHLTFIGRAITPVGSPIRFHARFFGLAADHLSGSLGGDGELSHLHWPTIEEALNLPVIDVTEHMLKETRRRFEEGTLVPAANATSFRSAIYIYRNGVPAPRYFDPETR